MKTHDPLCSTHIISRYERLSVSFDDLCDCEFIFDIKKEGSKSETGNNT